MLTPCLCRFSRYRFYPGRACKASSCSTGTTSPYGFAADNFVVTTSSAWVRYGNWGYDLAVIQLTSSMSAVGWMGIDAYSWPSSTGYTAG